MDNALMIAQAAAVVRPLRRGDYLIGDVGCALLTEAGNLYLGVCIDAGSGMGFCAEHNAIGAMVTAGEYRIRRIVAVWKNDQGELHVLAPCGRCREFMHQIHPDNIDQTEVILDTDKAVKLAELLPHHAWFHKIRP